MKMQKTGIVRRIDDLGRIVIPKEIRRELKIKEGDPLEVIKTDEGVLFIPYTPYGESDWDRLHNMLIPILGEFCILDCYGRCRRNRGLDEIDKEDALATPNLEVHSVGPEEDPYAFFVIKCDSPDEYPSQDHAKRRAHDVYIAHQVMQAFLEDK